MIRLVVVLSILACAFGAEIPNGLLPQLDGRIIGGVEASISSYPWQVTLLRNGGHFCGGSIYSHNIIVTAAHCVQNTNVNSLSIRAGSSVWNSGGVVVRVAASKVHENYNPSTIENDVAVLRLVSSLQFSAVIKSIGLTTKAPAQGAKAVVTGWGTRVAGVGDTPSTLQAVEVNIVREANCASKDYDYGSSIKSSMICAAAEGKDACQGDSGGPLVSGGVLVGIVSWGYGCARPNYPGVYSCVAALRSWVVQAAKTV